MTQNIPFGAGYMPLHLPDGLQVETLVSGLHRLQAPPDEDATVRQALAKPIGSPSLRVLAQGKQTATILCSDHTRPVPSRHILPHLLAELRAGNPNIAITLLVATGCHRETTKAELVEKMGEDIVRNETIVVHDCLDEHSLVSVGTLPSGAPLVLNRAAVETDLLLAEGFIEPHFFAGFSGGRKSVLPGVCSRVTVLGNHCSAFIAHPNARAGCLEGNPLHRDMCAAARMAKLAFICNVVLDAKKKVVAAFAGDALAAHEAGCAFLLPYCEVKPQAKGDIVLSSNGGAPLDQNIYQAVKGLSACEAAAAPGAVLILCAACNDGHGGQRFFEALRDSASPAALLDAILAVPQNETWPDQWQVQVLVRILIKHRVIFVAEPSALPLLGAMGIETAHTADEALALALAAKGPNARVTVIPDGVSVSVA